MPFCVACGTELQNNESSCQKCGQPATHPEASEFPPTPQLAAPPPPTTPPPPPIAPPAITPNQIAASQMAMGASATLQFQALANRVCPRCSHSMIVVFRRPWAGRIVSLIGLAMLIIPFFGWIFGPILIIIGIVMTIVQKGKARYQCPGCNYST